MKSLMTLSLAYWLAAPASAQPTYQVGIGDVLAVKVMDQDKLAGSYTVGPDKSISMPLIGRVEVGGRTVEQVRESVSKKLANGYLRYPVVSVSLEKGAGRRFFIYGEVKTPGEFPLTKETTTVMQAITLAGGLTKAGSESRVKILRPNPDGQGYDVIVMDLKKVIADGSGDEMVRADDIVIVREGWF